MQAAIFEKNPPTALPMPQPALRAGYRQTLSADELIELCRQGEPAAFDELIRRYEVTIYRQAYRLTGNYDDALDIMQEAFLRIYSNISSFQSAMTLPAWIHRIVVNIYYDTCRRVYRRSVVSLESLEAMAGDALLNANNHLSASLHSHAEAKERKHLLNNAISSLPDYHRSLVFLFYDEGLSYEEIAELLRIPVGTVKSRLHRARLVLRQRLAPERAVFID